jgi:PAS domain S-box-containing protein
MGIGADTVLLATWTQHAAPAPEAPCTAAAPASPADDQPAAAGGATSAMIAEPVDAAGSAAEVAEIPEPHPPDAEQAAADAHRSVRAAAPRPHPVRFVWQMEEDGQFTFGSAEFADAVGPRTAALVGQKWDRIATELALDPDGRVARAVASHETWSGIDVFWPVDTTGERVAVELSGLPVFDRDRRFRGYRGFGICRDVARLAAWPAHDPLPAGSPDWRTADDHPTSAGPPPSLATPAPDPRPLLTVVPAAKNVVPFRSAAQPADKRTALTPVERTAFREIGKTLAADGEDGGQTGRQVPPAEPHRGVPAPAAVAAAVQPQDMRANAPAAPPEIWMDAIPSAYAPRVERPRPSEAGPTTGPEDQIIDRLPLAVLVHRAGRLIYASRALLDWTGYADVSDIAAAGGMDVLFVEPGRELIEKADGTDRTLAIAPRQGEPLAVEARLFSVSWEDGPALALVLVRGTREDRQGSELALRAAEAESNELRSIVDAAADGVVLVERDGRIISLNRSAEALFGHGSRDLEGHPFVDLFAPESHRAALDQLDTLSLAGVADGGCEVVGRVRQGGAVPLFMTIGRVGEGTGKYCALFRDITPRKRAEEDLAEARRQAEKAAAAKSGFLARISRDFRAPLEVIIGHSEAMMEERLGPIGNERYRAHARDIHGSGGRLIALVDGVVDVSKIEAGELDLVLAEIDLNELTRECVGLMQPQANRERIIIRTSLSPNLPPIVADARSVRRIVLNLLTSSIRLTGAGGQVIVSTALTDRREAAIRIRDTGHGMSDQDVESLLDPRRAGATGDPASAEAGGAGLPLTKALAEANGATFTVESAVNAGTLVEITFAAAGVPGA